MLSAFLLLLLATTSLAMPPPTHELVKRNVTASSTSTSTSTRHDCMQNCTSQCGHGSVCDLVCSILGCPNMKRADLSGEFEKAEVARRSDDEDKDGFEDVEVVEA
ncbi:hypothetical protein NCS57_00684900 [Fusarium keratoplasticum]|uniref:Uncharacterized protein n=1 Tax=Fusarium keratoplasticum TaxID=1328300 RepID=A0ACC0QUQ1_9HYPO|nr:hypothetical protein NCS57_00684900 [Fusarium keratoplasticum]KAI8668726.1 hypothetical protein NCS57_00684900 [Fusarium keratoplasticum]